MRELGHYTVEIERSGLKIRFSAGGLVALTTALAIIASITAFFLLG